MVIRLPAIEQFSNNLNIITLTVKARHQAILNKTTLQFLPLTLLY